LAAWGRLARDLDPAKLDLIANDVGLADAVNVASDILKGAVRGRVVVNVNA